MCGRNLGSLPRGLPVETFPLAQEFLLSPPVILKKMLLILLPQAFNQSKFQQLHDTIRQIIAAEIRTAILIASFNIDMIGYPFIFYRKTAG